MYGTTSISSNIPPFPDEQSCKVAGEVYFRAKMGLNPMGSFNAPNGNYVCLPHPVSP